ncbi:MAG: hypothetical protein IT378_23675 [Sandaracinaceae bacterium]|nr:hypothetical protein [Sandaracinaceae bacterium]
MSEPSGGKKCPHHQSCPLFPLFNMQSALKIWQTMYCEAEYSNCARHKMSSEGRTPPLTLLPNGATLGHAHKANKS